jgi:2-polyprenyl-6-methoxyphenol hydroxylase-like FAD-dependent oxidoreductase
MSPDVTAVRTALVIGGGIAGPVTALALRKAGIKPTIYEAYANQADGIGGALTVAPNGLDALRIRTRSR